MLFLCHPPINSSILNYLFHSQAPCILGHKYKCMSLFHQRKFLRVDMDSIHNHQFLVNDFEVVERYIWINNCKWLLLFPCLSDVYDIIRGLTTCIAGFYTLIANVPVSKTVSTCSYCSTIRRTIFTDWNKQNWLSISL